MYIYKWRYTFNFIYLIFNEVVWFQITPSEDNNNSFFSLIYFLNNEFTYKHRIYYVLKKMYIYANLLCMWQWKYLKNFSCFHTDTCCSCCWLLLLLLLLQQFAVALVKQMNFCCHHTHTHAYTLYSVDFHYLFKIFI